MEDQEIGIVELEYDLAGNLTRTAFMATMEINQNDQLLSFVNVHCAEGEEKIKEQAQNVLAAYFQKNNDIELADREQYEIVTKMAEPCEYYPHTNKLIKKISIKFMFKKIK